MVPKSVFIAEKPSVAKQFAEALRLKTTSYDGYLESENCIITWCVGHLVTMSYPDAYDEKYSKKIVRKNVSIPAYLNTYGEIHQLNFSKILKDALMKIAAF